MCLMSKTYKVKPVALGYQVKKIYRRNGKTYYCAIHRSEQNMNMRTKRIAMSLEMGERYEVLNGNRKIQASSGASYKAGFHVWHHLKDARTAARRIYDTKVVIVRVRVGGKRIAGYNQIGYRGKGLVTVAPTITLLHEVPVNGKGCKDIPKRQRLPF